MRRTKEDAEQTRQDIIEAAMKVFNRQGYSPTKLSEIAKEAGTTRGAIYWHFENKLHLYETLVTIGLADLRNRIMRVLDKDDSFLTRIRIIFYEFCNLNDLEKMQYQLVKDFFITVKVIEELRPVLKNVYATGLSLINLLKEQIEKAQRAGELRSDINTENLAVSIMNFIAIIGEKVSDHQYHESALQIKINYDVNSFINLIFDGFNSLKA